MAPTEFVAKFQTKKIRSWRNSYKRVFGLTPTEVVTIDPNDFSVTNRFPYAKVRRVAPRADNPDDFTFELDGGHKLQFRCVFRAHLLSELLRLRALNMARLGLPGGGGGGPRFEAIREDHNGGRRPAVLRVMPHALCEVQPGHASGEAEKILREYRIIALQEVGLVDGDAGAVMLRICGRPKLFFLSHREELLRLLRLSAQQLGVRLPEVRPQRYTVDALVLERRLYGGDLGAPIVTYEVEKQSTRHAYPVHRVLAIYPACLTEKDAATAATLNIRPLKSIFALVRPASDGRELRVEYDDGDSRIYFSGRRDALAASVLDAALGVGNSRIVMASAMSDGHRLLPRHAVQEKSDRGFITETFFGPDTIEFYFLKRLSTVAAQCAALAAQAPAPMAEMPRPMEQAPERRRVGNVTVPVIRSEDAEQDTKAKLGARDGRSQVRGVGGDGAGAAAGKELRDEGHDSQPNEKIVQAGIEQQQNAVGARLEGKVAARGPVPEGKAPGPQRPAAPGPPMPGTPVPGPPAKNLHPTAPGPSAQGMPGRSGPPAQAPFSAPLAAPMASPMAASSAPSSHAGDPVAGTEAEAAEAVIEDLSSDDMEEDDARPAVAGRRVYVASAGPGPKANSDGRPTGAAADPTAHLATAVTLWGARGMSIDPDDLSAWDDEELLLAATEFNANVPPTGVHAHLDKMYVKAALTPLSHILAALTRAPGPGLAPVPLTERQSVLVSALLQAIYRIAHSNKGYRMMAEMEEARETFAALLHLGQHDPTLAFWTVSVLRTFMRCPLEPVSKELEFENKKYFLAIPELRRGLLDLLDAALADLRHVSATTKDAEDGDAAPTKAARKADFGSPSAAASEGATSSAPLIANGEDPADGEDDEPIMSPQATAAAARRAARSQARRDVEAEREREKAREAELDVSAEDDDPKGTGAVSTASDLVLMALSDLLEAVLCSRAETTPPLQQQQMLRLLAERHEVLLCLLRTSCALTIENAALLLTALVTREPRVADRVAESAMSEAVVLRHFYNGCFSPSTDQRYLSRYLVQIWMSGSRSGSAKRLLRRMVPAAFFTYLNMPRLTEPEEANLDYLEEEHFRSSTQASSANGLASSANVSRLRQRLKVTLDYSIGQQAQQEIDAAAPKPSPAKPSPPPHPTTGPVSPPHSHPQVGVTAPQGAAQVPGPGMSLAPPPLDPETLPENPVVQAQIATQVAQQRRMELRARQRSATLEVKRRLGQDNFRVLFFQLTQDQRLADLVWNARTRQELRTALETELASFERQQNLRGVGRVAWNFEQFQVRYESMSGELCVGGVYLRLFIESGDAFVASLPHPQRLFELLVRRMLVEADRNSALCNIAVRCLEKLYGVHHRNIGVFEDMDVVIAILARAQDRELQARALQLLLSLGKFDENAEYLLREAATDVLVAAAVMCHRNPPTIGNDLSRRTNILMLQNGGVGAADATTSGSNTGSPTASRRAPQVPTPSRSSNVLDPDNVVDANCPNMWYLAPPGRIPPPLGSEMGPYRIPHLKELGALGELHDFCLCAPAATSGLYDANDGGSGGGGADAVDTGLWRPLSEHPTLRWVVRGTGPEVLRPAGFSLLALQMLHRLATLHRGVDSRNVPFHPIPRAKQLLCRMSWLGPLTQCLLANDVDVVDTTARVLTALVAHNPDVNAKMYRTGVFFFALAHYGQNFVHVAKLLHATHLRQQNRGVEDAARVGYGVAGGRDKLPVPKRSALAPLLPPALILYLHTYGYRRFAETFCGDVETPEVIWRPDMRALLIDLIGQHLGDFPLRLRQHPLLQYDYTPCPTVVYPMLADELFCHKYYLRLLCDERRFPNWPIADPVALLYAALEFHRDEMKVRLDGGGGGGVRDGTLGFDDALALLGLEVGFDERDLRKAYRSRARKFHPDRNPQGRDQFEAVQAAYEFLTSPRAKKLLEKRMREAPGDRSGDEGPDLDRLLLVLHAQMLVYRRFPDEVKDYRYPAYPLLLRNLLEALVGDACPSAASGQLGVCLRALRLCLYTMEGSSGNAAEMVRKGGVGTVFGVLHVVVAALLRPTGDDGAAWVLSKSEKEADPTFPDATERAQKVDLLRTALQVLAVLADAAAGREAFLEHSDDVAGDLYILSGVQRLPGVVLSALSLADKLCAIEVIQVALCRAGVAWQCLPLLLRYDLAADVADGVSAEDDVGGAVAKTSGAPNPQDWETQRTYNAQARLAARVLGRMGGYMLNERATTPQPQMQRVLSELLTPPLARLLRNRRADALLATLNKDVETPTRIWNGEMRAELVAKVDEVVTGRPPRHLDAPEAVLQEGAGFFYSSLEQELCIGGVYIRLFVANASTRDVEDPVEFGVALLSYVKERLEEAGEESLRALDALRELLQVDEHCLLAVTERHDDVLGLEVLVALLRGFSLKSAHFQVASAIFGQLSPKEAFSEALCEHALLLDLVLALSRARTEDEEKSEVERQMGGGHARNASTVGGLGMGSAPGKTGGEEHCWDVMEALCSATRVAREMHHVGGVPLLVVLLVGHGRFSASMVARIGAMRCLMKMLGNPVLGRESYGVLTRLVPEGLVEAMAAIAPREAVNLWDAEHETPEIIWAKPMRQRLRKDLVPLVDTHLETRSAFPFPSPQWRVQYPELQGELRVGGVYVRLFLKNPNFALQDPMRFLEHLTSEALRRVDYELPRAAGGSGRQGPPPPPPGASSTALVVRQEDLLSILVSAAVYVLRVRPGLAERAVQWGHVSRCASGLKGCNDAGVTLSVGAGLALLRILHQLLEAPMAVDAAATVPQANLLVELRRGVEGDGTFEELPPDAAFVLEAMAKVVASPCRPASLKALLAPAIAGGLVEWLLELLEDARGHLAEVREPDAARVHVVQMLRSLGSHPDIGPHVTSVLDRSTSWRQYSGQRHDLYLTAEHRVDYFLTNDSNNVEKLLLTAAAPDDEMEQKAGSGEAAEAAGKGVAAASSIDDLEGDVPKRNGDAATRQLVSTVVGKSEAGFGMDLAVKGGRLRIKRFKEDQAGNPALRAEPALKVGDEIETINGSGYMTAKEAVALIKAAEGDLHLVVRREAG